MARSRLRGERSDHTLGATGLVNETYMRLFRVAGEDTKTSAAPGFADRAGFFAAAATAMRRVLIDHARSKAAAKRGGRRSERGGG